MQTDTKKAAELVPGDRVLMEDGKVRIVAKLGKGFVKYRRPDGKSEGSVLIDWKDGDWTQCAPGDDVTLSPPRTAKA